jgi:hypothetical protein
MEVLPDGFGTDAREIFQRQARLEQTIECLDPPL